MGLDFRTLWDPSPALWRPQCAKVGPAMTSGCCSYFRRGINSQVRQAWGGTWEALEEEVMLELVSEGSWLGGGC